MLFYYYNIYCLGDGSHQRLRQLIPTVCFTQTALEKVNSFFVFPAKNQGRKILMPENQQQRNIFPKLLYHFEAGKSILCMTVISHLSPVLVIIKFKSPFLAGMS